MPPLNLDVVLKRSDVGRSDDDPEKAIQVKSPGRAFSGSQELTSDAWAARLRECGGGAGLVAGDAEACTIAAIDLVIDRDKLVRRCTEASMPMRATSSRGAAVPTPEMRLLL
jgi:hypothetical protein